MLKSVVKWKISDVLCWFIIANESYFIFVMIIKIYRSFGEQMQKKGGTLGMEIQPPLHPRTMNRPRTDELESFFRSMKKSKVGLVVVVVPDKKSYGKMLIMFYTKPSLQDMRFSQ
jgi:hypothetical protein